jgi:hypothetical protein
MTETEKAIARLMELKKLYEGKLQVVNNALRELLQT